MNFLIPIILLTIIVTVYIYSKWEKLAFKKLEYKRYFNKERVFTGEKVRITTEIINRKILPLTWIEISSQMPSEFEFQNQKVTKWNVYKVVTSLLSYQRVKRHNTLHCNVRGYYTVYDLNILIGDYLGIKEVEKNITYPLKLVVYPEIKPLGEYFIDYKQPQGDLSVRRWIIPDPMEIIGAREYTSNDSFNSIDWKSTAKFGTLHVKKYDYTADPSLFILLDVQTNKIHWILTKETDSIEKGIRIAASITSEALKERIRVGYSSNTLFKGNVSDIFIKPSMSKSQKSSVLEALAKTTYTRRVDMKDLIRTKVKPLGNQNIIILLTSYISDELKNELNILSKKGFIIKIIALKKSLDVVGISKDIDVIYLKDKEALVNGEME